MVELEQGPLVDPALGVRRLVLGVRVDQERHHRAVHAGCRFDHVRRPPLATALVEERQVLARRRTVRGEVEVGAVRDALELAPLRTLEPEPVLDVDGPLRVVGELLLRVLEVAKVLAIDAEVDVPVGAGVDPGLVPLLVLARLDEELHLHLLELASAEDEVAGGDLVAEALADLADAERWLVTRGVHHVREVHEDALRGLRTKEVQALLGLDGAEVGLEQAVEHPWLAPGCLLYTSPSPRDGLLSRMPSS